MARLVNLTPHAVTIAGLVVPPSGTVARVAEEVTACGTITIEGVEIPLIAKRFGRIENLPEPQPGVILITSALVAQAAWAEGRNDVVCPGEPIRDDQGRVVGAAALCVAP